ncbi:MAG TPA: ParB/RepB/Spo0J family partition protein [Actinophytocola sp.]|jgi:hypothetical protein|uniref:ParB/RepB/Spo0J family partition protein n=1 Tax=Actinophytocola sp. TaxID=1872138 RepID=UPI002F92BB5B
MDYDTAIGRRDHAAPENLIAIVPVDSLLAADSPRLTGEDEERIRLLAETQAELPPILVHRPTMRVIDGMHRWRAARLRGDREITVEFFDGNEMEAFIRAVSANITHGLPLSRADREAAVARIVRFHLHWSDRALAELTGLSAPTVAAIRLRLTPTSEQVTFRLGRDGRLRPLSTADGRRKAGQVIAERPDASLREIAKAAGVSVGTARDVRERIRRGADPVPDSMPARGVRPESAPIRRPTPEPPPPDTGLVLQRLRQDPSLRFTGTGRALLQWLGVHAVDADQADFVRSIPTHCRGNLAALARNCVEIWTRLAVELEQQGEHDTA